MTGRVLVIGSVNADLLLHVQRHPRPGETLLASSSTVAPGGKGANQAVAAARLGAPTGFVGAVGDDAYAEVAVSGMTSAGVDLDRLVRVPGPTGVAVVIVAADGENSIVVASGANAEMDPGRIRGISFDDVAVCVLQGELLASVTIAAADAAAQAGARVLLNLAPVIDLPAATVTLANPLVVNEHEAALLLGALGVVDPHIQQTSDQAQGIDVARRLRQAGVPAVVVTLGASGAVMVDGDHVTGTHLPAPKVAARDTTGAGDAFVGALAARLAAGDDLAAAASIAVRVGAYAVQGDGAQPSYPWASDGLP
ncbi:MAG: ribokinase [Frankiaceae bacterium]